jgi:hypothetical protein
MVQRRQFFVPFGAQVEGASSMTPHQYILSAICAKAQADGAIPADAAINGSTVDALYDALKDADGHWDYVSEFRSGDVDTGLNCKRSRHYESKAVAAKINGTWVGWTYWYGGGKHGDPEAVYWMEYAYFCDCVEEEKVVTGCAFTAKWQAA